MSNSIRKKSGRRLIFRFSDMRIRTKLLAVIALIVAVFLMMVLTVVVSFHRIENVLGGVISHDMNNVMTNALNERELSSIVADLNLLLHTFFEDEAHLSSEGRRLLGATRVLARGVNGGELEAPLGLFVRRMEFLLEQCRAVNTALRHVSDADRQVVSGFDRLDEIIADKLINATFMGDDVSILQQLSVLVVGYRQSLLEIGKQHAKRWPETYYSPLDMEDDPLMAAIDELDFRLRTLIASDPMIADLGRGVIRDLQAYKNGLLTLNTVMVELKKRMLDVEEIKLKTTEILKKFDRDVVQAINAANTKVLRTFRVAETSLMVVSLALIVALILLTAFFFKSIIKKPMDDIRAGITAFRRGNLDVRIDLNRGDEWHLIEDALNIMAADLSSSYADLKKAQSFVSNIIDSMPSVLVGVDSEGTVTQWNCRAEQVTGIRSEKARSQHLGKVFPDLMNEMDRVKTSIRDRRVIKDAKVLRKDREETRYEDVTIYPLVANGVTGAVIRIDDVTERVRLEEMMIQSEKMLSVGGLAAGMAHEINNPLAGMMQTAGVMAGRIGADLDIPANRKAAREAGTTVAAVARFMELRGIPRMLETINESGRRVAEIVENMLSFARKSEAAVSTRDLGRLLDKTLELAVTDYDLKKKYDFKRITIEKEYADPPVCAPCEGTKIQQVLLNILRNGAEAMGDTVLARFILRTRREGNTAVMEIEDNGPGMDEQTRKRIFEPFFTTKPEGAGTGLGLSVSYFIITENHGGEMSVESSPGSGAKFIIRLPM